MAERIFGFHSQLAIEHALKAVLADRDASYPRTYDLGELVELLRGTGVEPPPGRPAFDALMPYRATYEDDFAEAPSDPLDRKAVAELVVGTLEWARVLLGERRD